MLRNNNQLLLLLFVVLMALILAICAKGFGEEEITEAYIVCYPGSTVMVRESARKTAFAGGELTVGDKVYLDGKKRNGYFHCVNMANEAGEGWVSSKYITLEEPVYIYSEAIVKCKGRLAARSSINGKVKRWLKPDTIVMVYYLMDEWCITDKGYIMTKYLEIG